MKAIKNFFSLYKFSTLKNKMRSFGVDLNFKVVLLYMVLSISLSAFSSILLKLNIVGLLSVMLVFIICIPTLMIHSYEYNFQRTRFSDITSYMERLIYSYQKSGKIYTALKDVRDVSNESIALTIDDMLKFIDEGNAKDNLYREAFDIIESRYKCSRLETLHNYLVDVELHGGKSNRSLEMLLDDVRSWSIRTLDYKADRKNIRNKVVTSMALALVTCVASLFMVPAEYTSKMTVSTSYQVGTVIVLSLFIILFDYTQKVVSKSYFDLELDKSNDEMYERATKRIAKFDKSKSIKKAIIFIGLGVVLSIAAFFLDFILYALPVDFMLLVLAYHPFQLKKSDVKSVEKSVAKAFPMWIRSLTLQLQVNNVGVAIQNTLKTCPVVLKAEIEKLLEGIEANPGSIEPFNNFCINYNLPDVKMSVNYLYYISNFGSEDMLEQLDYMIKQNDYMTINEEKIRNSDSLSVMSLLILAPMLIGMVKLMVDMFSLFTVFSQLLLNSNLGG